MNKFELTKKDKTIANEAYKNAEYLERFKHIKVIYLDGVVKKFKVDVWLLYRDDIRKNLFKQGKCKIVPKKKFKYLLPWVN